MLSQITDCDIGVDEVGRGCLLGPVVACAVALPPKASVLKNEDMWKKVKDSKKLSAKKRKELFDFITSNVPAYGVGIVGVEDIDCMNILNATMKAMHCALDECIDKLEEDSDHHHHQILIDGNYFKEYRQEKHTCFKKGDSLYLAIAAASIVAKHTRDTYIKDMVERFPCLESYGISKNMGYGTAVHVASLKENGVTDFHRKTFRPVKELLLQK